MKIYNLQQLKEVENTEILFQKIEKGFQDYSQGNVTMPPVGHIHFAHPPGDLHIKSAAINAEEFFAVKIASCFPQNSKIGLNSIQGLILLFNQHNGKPETLFMDEGYLTHLRTAIAGAICAKYLAPKHPQAIGIIGAGQQARYQLRMLAPVTSCREVWVWAPNKEACELYQHDGILTDFNIHIASSAKQVADHCRLIVTTTPACEPLLFAQDIASGTHITAVGSDRPGKQELDPAILKLAHRIVVDSRQQCFSYGETSHALKAGMITENDAVEIGEVIAGTMPGRTKDTEITVADLTGLGIQDLAIALAYQELLG